MLLLSLNERSHFGSHEIVFPFVLKETMLQCRNCICPKWICCYSVQLFVLSAILIDNIHRLQMYSLGECHYTVMSSMCFLTSVSVTQSCYHCTASSTVCVSACKRLLLLIELLLSYDLCWIIPVMWFVLKYSCHVTCIFTCRWYFLCYSMWFSFACYHYVCYVTSLLT